MVQGKFKSSRLRKRKVKVPGGQTKTRYLERKPKQARCGTTGEKLHGIPRMGATKAKNTAKTLKRPERPYGGVLSSRAMRVKMRQEAKVLAKGTPAKETALFSVGRLCLKIAGRDAGKRCVIVEEAKDGVVMIDGETRRRKCNVRHLEPLVDSLNVKKGATHADVVKAFAKLGSDLKASKPKKAAARPKRIRKKRAKPKPEAAKKAPAAEKKAAPAAPAKETPAAPAQPKQEEKSLPKTGAKVAEKKPAVKAPAKK